MPEKKEWQNFAVILKELLNLDSSPVSVNCIKDAKPSGLGEKVRICRAFLQAAKGQTLTSLPLAYPGNIH